MQRFITVLSLCLAVSLPAIDAEEISLKDGTKIVGHMTAVSTDKIEVETSYGKVQLNRGDIVTISFPENSRANQSAPAPAKLEAPKIDESLNGVQYINRTGKFVMTFPPDWVVSPEHRRTDQCGRRLRQALTFINESALGPFTGDDRSDQLEATTSCP